VWEVLVFQNIKQSIFVVLHAVVELPVEVETVFVLPKLAVVGELHHLSGKCDDLKSDVLRVLEF
jgi:hypothetical protein